MDQIRSFLSVRHAHGDLCKHLGKDSDDRYLNLFLNAYINRHAHTEYLKMCEVHSPLGIWHVFLYSINFNIYHFGSMKYRCNRPEFPPSQFFPRGKNGPAHSFPGEKIGRPILSPPSQFFPPPPLIISKIIMELLFLCINLKSRY